jgi:3-hydroxymyristoyl/3-hydroxydecanoyl-(acyl carrier protein) dehydratase
MFLVQAVTADASWWGSKMNELLEKNLIEKYLLQTYPFIFIDKVIKYEFNQCLVCCKNITTDEWYTNKDFHFPETLIIEGAAQTASLFFSLNKNEKTSETVVIGKVKAEFFNQVSTGDQVEFCTKDFRNTSIGGYINIEAKSKSVKICDVSLFYGYIKTPS